MNAQFVQVKRYLADFFRLYQIDTATPTTFEAVADRSFGLIDEEVGEAVEATFALARAEAGSEDNFQALAHLAKEWADVIYVCMYARVALDLPNPDRVPEGPVTIVEWYERVGQAFTILKADPDEWRHKVSLSAELAGLEAVVYEAAQHCQVDLPKVITEVHRSNMMKVWPDGTIRRREDGKILKPSTWQAPDIASILAETVERPAAAA